MFGFSELIKEWVAHRLHILKSFCHDGVCTEPQYILYDMSVYCNGLISVKIGRPDISFVTYWFNGAFEINNKTAEYLFKLNKSWGMQDQLYCIQYSVQSKSTNCK